MPIVDAGDPNCSVLQELEQMPPQNPSDQETPREIRNGRDHARTAKAG